MNHAPVPQYVPMFRRYQCQACHSWVKHDEWVGRWFHKALIHEEMKDWSWDGLNWKFTPHPTRSTQQTPGAYSFNRRARK